MAEFYTLTDEETAEQQGPDTVKWFDCDVSEAGQDQKPQTQARRKSNAGSAEVKSARKSKTSKKSSKGTQPAVDVSEPVVEGVVITELPDEVATKDVESAPDPKVVLSILSDGFQGRPVNVGPNKPHCANGCSSVHWKNGHVRKLRCALFVCATSIVILAIVTLCTSLFSFSAHINEKNELVGLNGDPVRTARIESYSTLNELSGQSLKFLRNMQGVSLKVGADVHHFKVSGFIWSNVSYMVIETTRDRDIVVAGGKAFIRDVSSGKVRHVTSPASEPDCGRRLVEISKVAVPASYSWNKLVDRYHAETTGVVGGRQWRRLDEGANHAPNDLYEWFGALISSDSVEETSKATESMRREYCSYDTQGLECQAYSSSKNPRAPVLGEAGFSKFIMMGAGETWLLYLDLSDWARGSMVAPTRRAVRSKMVSGVTRDMSNPTGSAMRVTESKGSSILTYQMPHPALVPERYNLSKSVDLEFAEAVLESAEYDDFKGECRQTTEFALNQDVDSNEELTPVSTAASKVTFNCDDGTFTWSIHGWRVQASADGTIQALIFSNASSTSSNEDEDHGQIRFKVLSVVDGGDARANFKLSQSFSQNTIFKGCKVADALGESRALRSTSTHRRLGRLGVVMQNTNWCGPGQCGSDSAGCRHNYCLDSFDGDWACRRHDACEKYTWGPIADILACSCDKDLYDNRGTGAQANVIAAVYGPYGVRPCISFVDRCRSWGWVKHGRRRRWGWSHWGVVGHYPCDNWNYVNKYHDSKMQVFGYERQIYNYDVHSKQDWPGCYDNSADFDVPNPF